MSTTISGAAQAAADATTTAAAGKKNTLGKDAFLQMLVAQLKNQDPLNPMDGTAFVAQLAQFSSLEQLQNLNTAMGSLPAYFDTFANAQMSNLIGKEAVAEGNVIKVSGSSAKIGYRLPSDIQSGEIKIYNAGGVLVDTLKIGSQRGGLQNTTWNCSGQAAGDYTFEVAAEDKNGKDVPVDKLISGTVSGVTYQNGVPYLIINGIETAFSSVVAISQSKNT